MWNKLIEAPMQWDRGIAVAYILNQQPQTPIFSTRSLVWLNKWHLVSSCKRNRLPVALKSETPTQCTVVKQADPQTNVYHKVFKA
jgi:hypothetical protein